MIFVIGKCYKIGEKKRGWQDFKNFGNHWHPANIKVLKFYTGY